MVIKQGIQPDPNNTVVRNLRERITRESELQAASERCEQWITSGKEQLSSLHHAKAVESFEAALRLDPDNGEAQGLLEQVRMAARKRERAVGLLVQAKRRYLRFCTMLALVADIFFMTLDSISNIFE
jgi:cytochrome c-type biogenesis protein CcmH/NrfG